MLPRRGGRGRSDDPATGSNTGAPWRALAWLALAGAAAFAVFGHPDLRIDDAFITLHNARTLLAGGDDPAYAGATALTGATSAVHLVAIAGLGLLMPLETASAVVSLVGILLYAAGLDRMAVQAGCSRILLVGLGLLTGYQALHLVNGLESGLAAAAVAWALVLRDARWLPVLCGTLPFVRPELALLALPLLARQGWVQRGAPDRVLRTGLLALAAAAPWMALSWAMTGGLVPATGGAKVLFFAESGLPLADKLVLAASACLHAAILLIAIGLGGLWRKPAGWCGAAFLLLWLGTATWAFPGGLAHNYGRYLVEAVPVLLFGLSELLTAERRLMAGVLVLCVLGLQAKTFEAARDTQRMARARDAMIATLNAKVPLHARVAVHDAGDIAWRRPDLRLTDVVGLKTPDSTRAFALHPVRNGDRGAALAAILAGSGAQYFVCLTGDPFWATLATDLARTGQRLEALDAGEAYTVYRLVPHGHPGD